MRGDRVTDGDLGRDFHHIYTVVYNKISIGKGIGAMEGYS